MPSDLFYGNPQAAWLTLLLFPLIYILWVVFYARRKSLSQFADPKSLSTVLIRRSLVLFWLKTLALFLCWIFAVIALMWPKGNAHYPEEDLPKPSKSKEVAVNLRLRPHEIILLMDSSASMAVPDSRNGASRLDYAKDIADLLVSRLNGETVSLYAFTEDVTQLSPPTPDYLYVRLMLRELQINEGGTAGTSLTNAMHEIQRLYLSKPSSKLLTVILLSDGEDNSILDAQGGPRQTLIENLVKEIDGPGARSLRILTVGMGTPQGGEIPKFSYQGHAVHSVQNSLLLQALAAKGRGTYFNANDYTSENIVTQLQEAMAQDNPYLQDQEIPGTAFLPPEESLIYSTYFQIPLGIAILLLTFYLFAPDSRFLLSKLGLWIFVFFPFYLQGSLVDDNMLEAARYVESKQYNRARAIYNALLAAPLPQWQKEIIGYDIGTTYLLGSQPDKALTQYAKIILEGHPFPPLARNVKTNMALAYYNYANQQTFKDADDYRQALFYLQEGLESLKAAKAADCVLNKAEGGASCGESLDLNELQAALEGKSALYQKEYALRQMQEAALNAASVNAHDLLPNTPQRILEVAFDLQRQALTLNRLKTTMRSGENWQQTQSAAIKAADQFTPQVLRFQKAQFSDFNLDQKERCQAHPWDQVMPLFQEGYAAALDGLKGKMTAQELALTKWRQALALFKQPKSSFGGGCEGGGGGGGGGAQQQKVKEQQALRSIEEMETMDRKPQGTPAIQVQGVKPW